MRKLPPLAKIIQRPSNKLELSVDLHELSDRLLRGEGTEALAERMLDALMEKEQSQQLKREAVRSVVEKLWADKVPLGSACVVRAAL